MNIQDIQLDINKSPSVGKWVTIGQGDKGGTTIRATVYDNGAAAALAGMSARFEMRMPNATYFEDTNCTVSGNVITYVVDESHAALYAGGGSEAYFALYDGDTAIYSTERFHVRVARAASDGANPGRAWTNGIEEWLEDASDELDGYVASADARVGATINAANAAVEGMRSDVDGAIDDTEDVIGRAESAIDAMGDISELAVPLMSKDVRGGAKLEEHGGLVLRDEKLGIGSLVQESDGAVRGGIAELTAKGHAEQDGTPTPDSPVEIQVVRGRNLLDFEGYLTSRNASYTREGDTYEIASLGNAYAQPLVFSDSPIQVTLSGKVTDVTSSNARLDVGRYVNGEFTILENLNSNTNSVSGAYNALRINYSAGGTFRISDIQLELGSVATPYVPYGHVGMEARDPDTDELISCTALPLPSRGWVAGLPDGTADSLRIDGAGKVEWELPTTETEFASGFILTSQSNTFYQNIMSAKTTSNKAAIMVDKYKATNITWQSLGNNQCSFINGLTMANRMALCIKDTRFNSTSDFNTWLSTHPVTVLYPLATPVTEECGYIEDWPTDIPEGATLSIRELDSVGIKYFIDSSVTELAKQWYAKARNEYEDRLEALESAVAELVTGA